MQMEDAARLREKWGDKPCDHPYLDKEYYLGGQTGDYVCIQCGKSGSESFWEKVKKSKEKK
ncbi:hypothetical protein QO009_003098 [Brevibacillus aydinogluensis]|uniref:hypothetical protein n=1 Tax=Brevibacillus aydinogluensis TaxID=927786 RepID=UPI002892CABC|nr:hypothetical protein [Brevibacillus aydinogluensis]MDT3417203.1 hypothetical protein [Brevibacillus aydinogluensis]